ncbi:MAG: aspartate--tRNA ligase [[Eubacterium] sulci]|jgi:aspartate--tRNA ligase|nr:aspartate--tRNA ligase [[Eubacterium] sulci]MBF1155790.1 aspartate--tRNA ligase [[Eubacterium] sulci]MBF1171015.1 aspartate--tRNA ligase [[Eubacterium] sulci]MBF1192834.1 aspartate--tRNA ligase [[Eubacterium] sulci]
MSKLIKRTHFCGVLNKNNIGEEVSLNGWVAKQRSLGSLIFVDLRDKTGIVQIVFDDSIPQEIFDVADRLRSEFVIGLTGVVRERSSKNPDLATGEIEVVAKDLVLYSESETPPIYVKDDDNVDYNLRMKYRYLELRKNKMQRILKMRHDITNVTRQYFYGEGFTEVETPNLIKSTPEGARDYLVPSRVNPGMFYALPQSPQLFKQLLMVSGLDRYIQIARCFRDEDLRSDRQPEFTQIDLEMSFVDMDDVLAIQEGYLKKLFHDIKGVDIKLPLRRMSYQDAMERFGSDKPDLRFGFELKDISELVKGTEFQVFSNALSSGGSVRGICIDNASDKFSRKDIDKLTENAKHYGAKGLVWIRIEADEIKSSVNKFFSQEELAEMAKAFDAKANDLILIAADKNKVVFDTLGFLRRHVADILGLLDDSNYELLWVTDFPMFEKDEETGALKPMHHPFTHPKTDEIPMLDEDPSKVNAYAYDIVINGYEAGGGSIRIHEADLQNKMFKILGLSEEDCQQKFGFLMDAFKYGAPPHGGIAYGLDRLVMLLTEDLDIRDVVAFPKNQKAQCLLSGAPAEVDCEQLKELSIATDIEEQ